MSIHCFLRIKLGWEHRASKWRRCSAWNLKVPLSEKSKSLSVESFNPKPSQAHLSNKALSNKSFKTKPCQETPSNRNPSQKKKPAQKPSKGTLWKTLQAKTPSQKTLQKETLSGKPFKLEPFSSPIWAVMPLSKRKLRKHTVWRRNFM